MKILITSESDFISNNLYQILKAEYGTYVDVVDSKDIIKINDFYSYDIIIHTITHYRGNNYQEFYTKNVELTKILISKINNDSTFIYFSSSSVGQDSFYAKTKLLVENYLANIIESMELKVYITRLFNEFGKWSVPNFNNVVTTFAYNISRDFEIKIENKNKKLNFQYIDDIYLSTKKIIEGKKKLGITYFKIPISGEISIEDLAKTFIYFENCISNNLIPNLNNKLKLNLYSVYVHFKPQEKIINEKISHLDDRGSFTEIFKFDNYGQISLNVSEVGITKGNHWHMSKIEKFVVISGKGIIRMRNIINNDYFEYYVSSSKLQEVEIPPGYTHNITNLGNEKLVFLIWANEIFDMENPDTYFEEV